MARIVLAPEVLDDFDRFVDFLAAHDGADAPARIGEIVDAIQVLSHSPLLGRKVANSLRELVIGKSRSGYVALYRHVAELDTVFVLAVKAQRESSYRREE